MRRPDHNRAKSIADERECPECSDELRVNQEGAYIDCENDSCDWLGWSYEYIGALS